MLSRFYTLILFSIWLITVGCSQEELELVAEEVEPYAVEEVEIISDAEGWDLPANEGIRNTLLNADQLVNLKYTPIQDFYKVGGTISKGSTIEGLIYSSTRYEDLFCPNNVSLWTFMSALKNPNSYLYTIDITEEPYSINGSAKAYYGQVCSSFVQYALGIKYNFQIHQMTVWPGIDKVYPQDIDKIRLGDILTTEKGHTRLITGIRREDGHVVEVAISEGISPCVKRKIYPVEDVLATLEDGYVFYRYRYINDTKFTPSPFVDVGTEELDATELPSDLLIPRRGDKANWRKDEEVIIDILDSSAYSFYRVYKDGQLYIESKLPNNQNELNLGVLPFGDYSMLLFEGEAESPSVYWMVVDYHVDVVTLSSGKVKVSYTSSNAIPIFMTWRRPSSTSLYNNHMPQWTTVIDSAACEHGYVVSELDSYLKKKYGLGEWGFKVAFETKYGIISSDSEFVNVK